MIAAFLRNDDVRDTVDDSLDYMTRKAIETGIPVTHAVEPGNTNAAVVTWLTQLRKKHPQCIGIIQHGYEHRIKTPAPYRGEFGRGRPFAQQFDDISRGAALMDQYFGNHWARIFSFPFGAYDGNTLKALEMSGFRAISTGIRLTPKRQVFNRTGQLLRTKHLLGQNIVYFNEMIPGYDLFESPVVVNNTKYQNDPDTGVQKTADELMAEWRHLPRTVKVRGILCHHRFNSRHDIDHLFDFLMKLKSSGTAFARLEDLHE